MRLGLVSLFSSESSITNLVSTRIYVDKPPQGAALPNIVVEQLGSDELPALDGTPGLRFVDFRIHCRADLAIDADAVGKAVRVFMDDYTGTAGSEEIDAVLLNDERATYEHPEHADDIGVHNTFLEMTVQYSPA